MPADGTVNCCLKLVNASRARCDGGEEFICGTPDAWGGQISCDAGRFVPTRCRTPDGGYAPHCGEVLMAYPTWSTSWWEAVLLNNNMNFTLAYVGDRLNAEVRVCVCSCVRPRVWASAVLKDVHSFFFLFHLQ